MSHNINNLTLKIIYYHNLNLQLFPKRIRIMKNINNKLKRDAMAKDRKHPLFKKYSQEAKVRILLAAEIYDARNRKGLSQQKLAKNIKTTQKEISKIENGQINVGVDLIYEMAKNLDLKFRIGKTRIL